MPFISSPITRTTQPSGEITSMHRELVALSLPIAMAEPTTKHFGSATAVKVFQKRYRSPQRFYT